MFPEIHIQLTRWRFRAILSPQKLWGNYRRGNVLETIFAKIQRITVMVLAGMLVIVVILSTAHLGLLIGEEIWQSPRFLLPVQGLLDIFGYFLLVLIGVELLETLRAYLKQDVIHVRVVLEVALIAMARKAIIQEPGAAPGMALFGTAALIVALALAFYFERRTERTEKRQPEA
ncbi:MAG: phosphate-starvation-inducible PsiE family protein [Terriglobales bacterium]